MRSAPPTRSASRGARSGPTTPTPPGLLAALPSRRAGGGRWCSAPAARPARSVWALLREGASVEVWNRTALRSRNLCEELGGAAVEEPDAAAYDLIVNSTAVGLGGEDPFAELPLRAEDFAPGQVVVDIVYGDKPSALLTGAEAAGARGGRDRGAGPAGGASLADLDRPRGADRRDAGGSRLTPRCPEPLAPPGAGCNIFAGMGNGAVAVETFGIGAARRGAGPWSSRSR